MKQIKQYVVRLVGAFIAAMVVAQPTFALTEAAVDYRSNLGTNITRIGYTYERQGDEYDATTENQQRVDQTVRTSLSMQSRHVIGFGTGNIWLDPRNRDPNSDAWNWKGLDDRINRLRASAGSGGAEIVLTAGLAPNWMTTMEGQKDDNGNYFPNNEPVGNYSEYPDVNGNGIAGEKYADNPVAPENQDRIYGDEQGQAPDPWYEDDFAYMIKQVALRYPDVKVWQVWNEFKGMYRTDLNRWDYERYTRVYNKVYTALKEVNPDNKVGGPYLSLNIWTENDPGNEPTSKPECRGSWGVMSEGEIGDYKTTGNSSVYSYWLKNKVGADFLLVDFGTKSWRVPNDPYDPFQTKARIDGVMNCVRNIKDENGVVFEDAKNLPVGIAEFYANVRSVSPSDNGANDPASETERAAMMANAAGNLTNAEYSYSLFWDLMTSADGGPRGCDPTNTAGTLTLLVNPTDWKCNDPTLRANESAIAPILRQMKTVFAANASVRQPVKFDTTKVGIFASNKGTMLVNKQNGNETVRINGCEPVALTPFQVRFVSPQDCDTPSTPDNAKATPKEGGVLLTWEASSDQTSALQSYRIYRDGQLIATLNANQLNYTDTTGTSGQLYQYRIVAVDAFDNVSLAATLDASTQQGDSTPTQSTQVQAPDAPNTGVGTGKQTSITPILLGMTVALLCTLLLVTRLRPTATPANPSQR